MDSLKGVSVQSSTLVNTNRNTSGEAAQGGNAEVGDIWKKFQAEYGRKPEKAREIKKTLGKDDFLRIMITQMKHQDPTEPFKAEKFGSEMAQFTSVEQLQNLNQAVAKMSEQNRPLERLAMTNLIGKTVTVDRDRFPHTEGKNETLTYHLPEDASQVRVAIINTATGEEVIAQDLGETKAGDNAFVWDGRKANTITAPQGDYLFSVSAANKNGTPIQINTAARAQVVGVSYEGTEPVLLIGDPGSPQKVTMKNIVRIEDLGASRVPGAKSLSSAVAASSAPAAAAAAAASEAQGAAPKGVETIKTAQTGNNFFTFQKGVGSTSLDQTRLAPEVNEALKQYQVQKAEYEAMQAERAKQAQSAGEAAESGGAPEAGVGGWAKSMAERGFPNGLDDLNHNNQEGGE